jgi:hypothetical protein
MSNLNKKHQPSTTRAITSRTSTGLCLIVNGHTIVSLIVLAKRLQIGRFCFNTHPIRRVSVRAFPHRAGAWGGWVAPRPAPHFSAAPCTLRFTDWTQVVVLVQRVQTKGQ